MLTGLGPQIAKFGRYSGILPIDRPPELSLTFGSIRLEVASANEGPGRHEVAGRM
jgi:hypothetical protein